MQTDMTVGKPMKMILDFTIPVFIGNVFQQFYNMADAIIVGKFVGTKGLAAVGSTGTIMFLIIGFLTGLTAGFTVLTHRNSVQERWMRCGSQWEMRRYFQLSFRL